MKKVFAVGIIVIVGIVIMLSLGGQKQDIPNDDAVSTTTPMTENTQDNNSSSEGSLEKETTDETTTVLEEPVKKKVAKPRIAISPYSVYIGFATEVGTSSESLMNAVTNEAVVGYEWEALPGSQMFSSLIVPQFDESPYGDDKKYTVSAFDEKVGDFVSLGDYRPGEKVDFPRSGVIGSTRFKISGIDPDLLICPGYRKVSWKLRFVFDGELGLVKTPITKILPAGEKCQIL